jgi:outer membrane protein insertion porin family
MVLKLDLTEKSTGMFSFGAGYSSEESFFLVGSIALRNFLGRGQTIKLNGTIGGSTTRYTVSFTEPWLFDTQWSATVHLYDQDKDYNEYDLDSLGGGLSFGYPVFDYTRLYFGYSYDISDVTIEKPEASDTIRELEGTNTTSKVHVGMAYDSRYPVLYTNEGSKHSLTFWHAGLGGDIGFNKAIAETGWYIPLFKGFVGFLHGKAGVVKKTSDDKLLPDYQKFYLGGINTMRGYEWRGIHLSELNEKGELSKVGGELMVQFNFEFLIPLYPKLGVRGVVFYDMGNVYDDYIDLGDLRSSWGYGIRWNSPLAPIRVEYGHVIDPREGEEDGRLEFTLGGAF